MWRVINREINQSQYPSKLTRKRNKKQDLDHGGRPFDDRLILFITDPYLTSSPQKASCG